jgi:hypothetical protein
MMQYAHIDMRELVQYCLNQALTFNRKTNLFCEQPCARERSERSHGVYK